LIPGLVCAEISSGIWEDVFWGSKNFYAKQEMPETSEME
jgi:hypothetical protein